MVSVIIPNYNHAQFLEQRIQSVIDQTHQNFEVIILDDFSTDSSRSVIEKYRKHAKVSSILYNTENSGSTFKQWRRGIELAKGDWIWLAESDDFAELNFLETLLNNEKLSNTKFRYCSSEPVDINSKGIVGLNYRRLESGVQKGYKYLLENLIEVNAIVNASSVIISKDILIRAMDELKDIQSYKLFGDWIIWFKICLEHDIGVESKIMNFHRHHSSTVRFNAISSLYFFNEQRSFRGYLRKLLFSSNIPIKGSALHKLKKAEGEDYGNYGCSLVRNRIYLKGFYNILIATVRLNFNLYFIKSGFYWLLKQRGDDSRQQTY